MISITVPQNQWSSARFHATINAHVRHAIEEMPPGTDIGWIQERVLKTWIDTACPAGNT